MLNPLKSCLTISLLVCVSVLGLPSWSDESVKSAEDPKTSQPAAQDVLDQAKAQARKDDKKLLVVFSAEWCRWCRHMEALLSKPEMATLLAVDFVVVKIDLDKMAGAEEIHKQYRKEKGGIPWSAVLNTDGEFKGSFVGYPLQDEHIEQFMGLLTVNRTKLTDEQLKSIREIIKSSPPTSAANATPKKAE